MKKRRLLPFLLLGSVLLAGFLGTQLYLAFTYSAKIDLLYTPAAAQARLDGKPVKAGIIRLKPGRHSLAVTMKGFAPLSRTIDTARGEAPFIGIILEPDTPATAGWYRQHPEDQLIREKIMSIEADQLSEKAAKVEPFLRLLPYYAPGDAYEIGMGQIDTKTGRPTIVITTHTETAKEDALTWIRSSGYDPDKMRIQVIEQLYYTASPAGDSVLYAD